eukprot:2404302-Rhodomonas_salina.1
MFAPSFKASLTSSASPINSDTWRKLGSNCGSKQERGACQGSWSESAVWLPSLGGRQLLSASYLSTAAP